eukprot:10659111-Lingulodinium_polyedra.AAC.1
MGLGSRDSDRVSRYFGTEFGCCVRKRAFADRVIMSMLSYSDARFGLDQCEIIAFYPRDCASQDADARPRAEHIEQGHMVGHVFERVSSAYVEFRLTDHKAARKR